MRIVFATGNENKLVEIRRILGDIADEVVSMREASVEADPEETGHTFAENALIKAEACAALLRARGDTGWVVMADDSGLEIDALGGEPGIYSARYLGRETPYPEKNQILIDRLKDVPEEKRTARFVCAMAAVRDDAAEPYVAVETMEGRIAYAQAGENGFGYDPIFYLPEKGMTSAELPPDEKNAISHRGKALRKVREHLQAIYGGRL